ncbi:MAG TPA: SDR family NAD(P)-dependent oxidoreductase [Candidatus Ratteibacteria bacterium]|nr:SDR family NAD(P)-dependent oxidoreductase [Candidatus Ratteibacteria bacterium]
MKLKDEVAIVTGAAGYIGSTTAKKLASEGANIVVCDMNIDGSQRVVEDIISKGGKATAIQLDVTNTDSIENMVKCVIEKYGHIDILINVAGGSERGRNAPVHNLKEEVIRETIAVNLLGVIFCSRAVVGYMIERKKGKIVSVASVLGLRGKRNFSSYSAAKAGVIVFSKTLAMEVGPYNINVNCVSPVNIPRPGEPNAHIPTKNYFGRIPTADCVANLIYFLVSDEADFITGQNYIVDGGETLGLKGA